MSPTCGKARVTCVSTSAGADKDDTGARTAVNNKTREDNNGRDAIPLGQATGLLVGSSSSYSIGNRRSGSHSGKKTVKFQPIRRSASC